MTELIEKNIKLEYLKKYLDQLRIRETNMISAWNDLQNSDYKSDQWSEIMKVSDVIACLIVKIQKYENDILNIALKEIEIPEAI